MRAQHAPWLIVLAMLLLAACGPRREERVQMALNKGRDFLCSLQDTSGEMSDSLNPLFDIWETVEAASALQAAFPETASPQIRLALAFLERQENTAGLLCHNRVCHAATCLETSSEYLLLRQAVGKSPSAQQLDSLALLQQADGSWLIGNPDVLHVKNFPSVSGFALSALLTQDTSDARHKNARAMTRSWILSQQTTAGEWGSTWEYYGCPGYALWPILRALRPLAEAGDGEAKTAIDKATTYIIRTQKPDGSWNHSLPPSPQQHDSASTKRVSPSLQSALMLAAYLESAPKADDSCLLAGIDFLLASQTETGAWDGGFFPIPHARYEKREYVFATAMAVRVLAKFNSLQATQP